MTRFGEFFSHVRRERLQLSLREFCTQNSLDAGNISKLERGILPPPKGRDKLTEYARMLGLEEGSDEWFEFFDFAAASRGELPDDVMNDQEVVARLPVLFRTLRGERVSEDQLRGLLDLIRRA